MLVEGNTRKLTIKPTISLKLQGNIASLLKQRVSFQRFVPVIVPSELVVYMQLEMALRIKTLQPCFHLFLLVSSSDIGFLCITYLRTRVLKYHCFSRSASTYL